MKINAFCKETYKFLFHPWSDDYSLKTRAAATITDIALTIFSAGLFLIPFGICQFKDRKVKVISIPTPPPVPKILSSAAKKSPEMQAEEPEKSVQEFSEVPIDREKVQKIKDKQKEQLAKFEEWAEAGEWGKIHNAHYDWWMYPVDWKSRGYKKEYQLIQDKNHDDLNELTNDKEFMQNYRRGVELGAAAWGWDIINGKPVDNPAPDQKWQNHPNPIRLGKMAYSLSIFLEWELLQNLRPIVKHASITGLEPYAEELLSIQSESLDDQLDL